MISDYLDRLGGALSFDRALAHRVRVEIEDHLREGTAADPSPDRRGAEKRAIAACGDPRALAAEFAVIALAKRTRRLGVGVFLGIVGVLIAMKARVAWYALMQCAMSDDVRSVAAFVGSIDAGAFWASLVLGIAGAAYLGGGRAPTPLARTRRFRLLCAAATAALTVSVISDGVLTSIRRRVRAILSRLLDPVRNILHRRADRYDPRPCAASDVHGGVAKNVRRRGSVSCPPRAPLASTVLLPRDVAVGVVRLISFQMCSSGLCPEAVTEALACSIGGEKRRVRCLKIANINLLLKFLRARRCPGPSDIREVHAC